MKKEDTEREGKVTIMGENISDKENRDRGLIGGTIFIVGGIILLLNNLDIVSWRIWDYIWRFWPLLLIIWGLRVILGRLGWIASLAGALLVILVGLFAVYQVTPELLSNLPPFFYSIFDIMNGLQR